MPKTANYECGEVVVVTMIFLGLSRTEKSVTNMTISRSGLLASKSNICIIPMVERRMGRLNIFIYLCSVD